MKQHIKPLPHPCPVWDRDDSGYPETLLVSMEDGHVLRYVTEIKQPAPVLGAALDTLDKACGYKCRLRRRRMQWRSGKDADLSEIQRDPDTD